MTDQKRPVELGYRWPAEWEPHAATWLAWPHNRDTWPGKFGHVPDIFRQIVSALASHESVHVLAAAGDVRADAEHHLRGLENVVLHDVPTNDSWIRDYGPTFLQATCEQPAAIINWRFDSWGGKYPPCDLDNAVPVRLAEQLEMRVFGPGLTLEGGAIEGNGQGTIMATESSLICSRRNPTMTRPNVEQYMREYLGGREIVWLPGSRLAGDDTDGHVDQLARFVSPSTVVVAHCEDTTDENYPSLESNRILLSQSFNQTGERLEVITLPTPAPIHYRQTRLPASYCNYYVANGVVLVPKFNDPHDDVAGSILGECFPGREIRQIDAVDLIWGLGAFHCLTQQQCVGSVTAISS